MLPATHPRTIRAPFAFLHFLLRCLIAARWRLLKVLVTRRVVLDLTFTRAFLLSTTPFISVFVDHP
jgi:hypothetical protein